MIAPCRTARRRRSSPAAVLCLAIGLVATCACGQDAPATRPTTAPATTTAPDSLEGITAALPALESPGGAWTAIRLAAVLAVVSLAPAILVMVTCFTRIVVVLGLLRQALGTQQLPPNAILFGLALLMTAVVMAPTYRSVYGAAIGPYTRGELAGPAALDRGVGEVRGFMIRQVEQAGNGDEVYLFLPDELAGREDLTWRDVPTVSLIPAFVVSELKVAFAMGFRIFLPFLVIDLLVASVLVSMGMLMLPPVLISLPFKLLLFVLADGWNLVVGTLMTSFG